MLRRTAMTKREKIVVLNELINRFAQSDRPHESDYIYNVLKAIKADYGKEEAVSIPFTDGQVLEMAKKNGVAAIQMLRYGRNMGTEEAIEYLKRMRSDGQG